MAAAMAAPADRQWYIVGRWQEYAGEGRANLLRILALAAFYGVELWRHYLAAAPSEVETRFHQNVTILVAAWSLLALGVLLCLRRRFLPAGLKYASTLGDLVLLTALAALGPQAQSPLVAAYFVLIALTALRFSLPLLWLATLGSMAGYLILVGLSDPKWFDAEHATPVVEQLLMLLSLGTAGVVLGQVVRRVRGLAEEYAERLAAAGGTREGGAA